MTIKMILPDNSPNNKRRRIIASGGYVENNKNEKDGRKYANSNVASVPINKSAQAVGGNVTFTQPMFFSPLHTPQNWQTPSKRREVYQWCRFYYSSEPKVAAGVDFYSTFSMNGFKLECKSKKVLRYFEKISDNLKLPEVFNEMSHEYFLIGDVFPFEEISCPHCGGKGAKADGTRCNHPDGTFKSIKIMNPDYIEVKTNPIADEAEYFLVPDEELRMIIQRKEPKKVYEKLPPKLIQLIAAGQPIPLSNKCISHIKHNASPYGTYGTSLLQRLFTILAYKTKIMTANWIVAERLILPVRVVKVGEKDRPATDADLQDVTNQLSAVANDPNLTIVTHHAFEYEWFGASGKIHDLSKEIESIGKEILDGLMLNQAILNGEMAGYSSAQVGVEVLIRRLENWRNKLKNWAEKHIFLPIAMMQGFIDEEESKIIGERVYLYPKLVWNDLQLRDKTNKIQSLMQLFEKGIVSAQTVLKELDLDYDTEIEKIRDEQITASANGMIPGGGQGGGAGGAMGMPGGAPGGGAPGGAPGGDMGGSPMGGAPGGDMGAGGMGGDMGAGAAAGGAPGGATANALPKITKRGKGGKDEQQQGPPAKMIKFTKLEQQMYKILKGIDVPYNLFAQYSVKVPGEQRPFTIDFAYPNIGVGVETDGAIWHQREDFVQRDKIRDQKLANVGWRIMRFREDAIEENPDAVKDTIFRNMAEAVKSKKKASENPDMVKYASVYDYMAENQHKDIFVNEVDLPDGLGKMLLIGTF